MASVSRLAIVGGGPAALMAAYSAAITSQKMHKPIEIIVLERNRSFGKKLLCSGSGQCNLTYDCLSDQLVEHYGDHGTFLHHAFQKLPPQAVMQLFTSWNVPLTIRQDGKVFPRSLKSIDVLNSLLHQCKQHDVVLKPGFQVHSIKKKEEKFIIETHQQPSYESDAVIVATGGLSYPKTGSTGDGYRIAKKIGHTIIPPHAALNGVKVEERSISKLSGLSFAEATVSLIQDGKPMLLSEGSLLITHDGLSGPAILNASRYLSEGDSISIGFGTKSDLGQSLFSKLVNQASVSGSQQVRTVVSHLGFPMSFVDWILLEIAIEGNKKAAETSKTHYKAIASAITDHRFVISLGDWQQTAMVTAGGVSLEEIDSTSMMSTIVKHLYFAGEVLDIDGDTGGFNLQAAWATGYLAGTHAACAL